MKLRIDKAIYGGAGLARAESKAVFVPFTLPGELVEAEIAEQKKSYETAELTEVLEPSAERRPAPCPHFGACGGCHYQHANYAAQVEIKRAILREALERARVREIPEIEAAAGEPFGYRNRVRLHVERNQLRLCYKRRNSHVNLPIKTCPIAAPVLGKAIPALNREGEALGLGKWAREVELFTDDAEGAMLVAFWTDRPKTEAARLLESCWPELQKVLPGVAGAGAFSVERGETAGKLLAQTGDGALTYRADGRRYRVSLGSFFQVNRFLVDRLVELVTRETNGNLAWDLYAGVGLFSLALAELFGEVVAVESSGASVRDLRENLRGTHHRVVSADTGAFLKRAVEQRQPVPDWVVVDPPRAGLGREVTTLLGKVRARNVTYVSCDPATLSRDVAALLESGYRLAKMHLVDLFPQTFHLESVTHLTLD